MRQSSLVLWRESFHFLSRPLSKTVPFDPTLSMMTQAGRHALATSGVEPFRALVDLLYSEKKPGDIPARQLIVEMLLGIFSIYPDNTPCPMPVDDSSWGCPLAFNGLYVQQLEEPPYATEAAAGAANHTSHDLVKSLVQGPPDEKHVRQVTWLASTHRSRPYKRWVQELTGTISDFFWIFCHSQNLIPSFDLSLSAPGPQVPGGMTDGVEAIAMGCCASSYPHFQWIIC